jgi:predicted AlkP superfamily pyrophosphatase or phosphodiesterase
MGKVVLVVSDGLRDDTARERMGYLEHLVDAGQATRYTAVGELPSLSRPMYETIQTGVPVSVHGVTSNQVVRRSIVPNVFRHASEAGRSTGAAAYFWYSELYNGAPYERLKDREVDDAGGWIQHGRFYTEDDFPDIELFQMAGTLTVRYAPDYLLVHPMGMDFIGEAHGSESARYRNQATLQDILLANMVPLWRQAGYAILVTGDHGIDANGSHGGTTDGERLVPLYVIPTSGKGRGRREERVSHLCIAPTVCRLLGLEPPMSMACAALTGVEEGA